jgi:FGGY-family pentulose kinase
VSPAPSGTGGPAGGAAGAPVVVGIDLGTESVRLGAFDLQGRRVASARRTYPTAYPHDGWAEQDVESWWPAIRSAMAEVQVALGGRELLGIGVSTTASTVVVLDAEGQPLRPAIMWMDNRAVDEVDRTAQSQHPVMAWSGGADAVEWLVPKAMWLARHEPRTYEAAHRIVEAVDYVNFRLTGEWAASQLNATCKWNYDPLAGRFHDELYAELGVPDLQEKWPDRVVPLGEQVGVVSRSAAVTLGVPAGVPVLQGGIDAHIGMLGTNTLADGRVNMVAGTSIVHLVLSPHEVRSPSIWGPYPDAILPGTWLVEGGQVSAGSVLRWFVHEILGEGADPAACHARLMAEAATLPIGAEGLSVCDFWQGNRTPYRDARLRGSFVGLSLHHTRAHMYRAIVEAIACGSRNALAAFSDAGVPLSDLVVSGGIRDNPLWLQATADVCGRPLQVMREPNASLLGAAVSAAAGAGHYADLREAAAAMSHVEATIEPNPAAAAASDELFGQYLRTVEATAGLVTRPAAPVDAGGPPGPSGAAGPRAAGDPDSGRTTPGGAPPAGPSLTTNPVQEAIA